MARRGRLRARHTAPHAVRGTSAGRGL